MIKLLKTLLGGVIVFYSIWILGQAILMHTPFAEAAPARTILRSIWPEVDSLYEIGTTTRAYFRGTFDQLCLTGDSCKSVWPSGDVVGPASATNNAIARFDATTGKLIQDSGVTIDDLGNITTVIGGAGTLAGLSVVTDTTGDGIFIAGSGVLSSNGRLIEARATAAQTQTTAAAAFFAIDNPASTFAKGVYVIQAGDGDGIFVDKNNTGTSIFSDKDVTNANFASPNVRIDDTSVATDGATYTKTGASLQINSNVTETSGTITDTAQVLDINQTHADATGNVVDIANTGTGNALYIQQDGLLGASKRAFWINSTNDLSAVNSRASLIYSNFAHTVGTMTEDWNDNSASAATLRRLTQDGTGTGLLIDQNNNGLALDIDHDGNSASAITGLKVNVANAGGGASYAAVFEAGDVGVGTVTPSAKLAVRDSTSASFVQGGQIRVERNSQASGVEGVRFQNGAAYAGIVGRPAASDDLVLGFSDGSTFFEGMRMLANSRKVGIGATSPNTKLDIRSDINAAPAKNVRLINAGIGDGTGQRIGFSYNTNDADHAFVESDFETTNGGQTMKFATGGTVSSDGTVKMVIAGNGNVGIANTAPAERLDVTGNGKFSGGLSVGASIATTYAGTQMLFQNSSALISSTNASTYYQTNFAGKTFDFKDSGAVSRVSIAMDTGDVTANKTIVGNGTVGAPSVAVGDAGGLYRVSAGILGIVNSGGNALGWNGNAFYSFVNNSKDLGLSSLRWAKLWITNIDISGVVTWSISSPEPSAPAASNLSTFVKDIAGKLWVFNKETLGQSQPNQTSMWNSTIIQWRPTTVTAGLWVQTVGAGAGTFANTLPSNGTLYTQQKRALYSNIVTTTNQVLGQRNTEALFWRGDSDGEGGFFACSDFGFTTWTNGSRAFFGLHSGTTVVSADPSALNNTVGFAVDAADNGAISFLTRGTAATKASTGLTIVSGKGYKACFQAKPNDTQISWWIKDIGAGTEASGVATTTLPTNTTFLTVGTLASNGALTPVNSTQLGVMNIYVEKDY